MNNCKSPGFSTDVPNWKVCCPSCWERTSPHSFSTADAALFGSPISLPATRARVQISVVGAMAESGQLKLDNDAIRDKYWGQLERRMFF